MIFVVRASVCILSCFAFMQAATGKEVEKQRDAQEQLQLAVKMQFTASPDEKKAGYIDVIAAYRAIAQYFPQAHEQIDVAEGNIAGLYAYELGQKEKARDIYQKLLATPGLSAERKSAYIKGSIVTLPGVWGSMENADAFADLRQHVNVQTGEIEVEYALAGINDIMKTSPKTPLEDSLRHLQDVDAFLQNALLEKQGLTFGHAMTIRHLLGQLPCLAVGLKDMDRRRRQPAPPAVTNVLSDLLYRASPKVTSSFPPSDEFDIVGIAEEHPDEMLSFVKAQRSRALQTASKVVLSQARKGKLDNTGEKYLSLIAEWRAVECQEALKRAVTIAQDEACKKRIAEVITMLEPLGKEK